VRYYFYVLSRLLKPKLNRSASIQVPTLIGCFFYLLKSLFYRFPISLSREEVRII